MKKIVEEDGRYNFSYGGVIMRGCRSPLTSLSLHALYLRSWFALATQRCAVGARVKAEQPLRSD